MPKLRPPKFYIAAPFFNDLQIDLVKRIETIMIEHEIPFFSPRLQDANKPGKITNELAAQIFRNNVENLDECDAVLAVLDWTLPENVGMYVIQNPEINKSGGKVHTYIDGGHLLAGPVLLPDTGTVFEMGHAYAIKKMIFGFTLRPPEAPLNVMLTQCCAGLLTQWDDLPKFLNHGDIQTHVLQAWGGRNQ